MKPYYIKMNPALSYSLEMPFCALISLEKLVTLMNAMKTSNPSWDNLEMTKISIETIDSPSINYIEVPEVVLMKCMCTPDDCEKALLYYGVISPMLEGILLGMYYILASKNNLSISLMEEYNSVYKKLQTKKEL